MLNVIIVDDEPLARQELRDPSWSRPVTSIFWPNSATLLNA